MSAVNQKARNTTTCMHNSLRIDSDNIYQGAPPHICSNQHPPRIHHIYISDVNQKARITTTCMHNSLRVDSDNIYQGAPPPAPTSVVIRTLAQYITYTYLLSTRRHETQRHVCTIGCGSKQITYTRGHPASNRKSQNPVSLHQNSRYNLPC